jgi:hypothetical protein
MSCQYCEKQFASRAKINICENCFLEGTLALRKSLTVSEMASLPHWVGPKFRQTLRKRFNFGGTYLSFLLEHFGSQTYLGNGVFNEKSRSSLMTLFFVSSKMALQVVADLRAFQIQVIPSSALAKLSLSFRLGDDGVSVKAINETIRFSNQSDKDANVHLSKIEFLSWEAGDEFRREIAKLVLIDSEKRSAEKLKRENERQAQERATAERNREFRRLQTLRQSFLDLSIKAILDLDLDIAHEIAETSEKDFPRLAAQIAQAVGLIKNSSLSVTDFVKIIRKYSGKLFDTVDPKIAVKKFIEMESKRAKETLNTVKQLQENPPRSIEYRPISPEPWPETGQMAGPGPRPAISWKNRNRDRRF